MENFQSPLPLQKFYQASSTEIFRVLKTKREGLSTEEANERLKKFGLNKLSEKGKISPLKLFIDQFKNMLILILIVAATLTYAIYFFGGRENSDLIEGSLILAIVVMIALLGFIQEYRAERAIEALKKLLAFRAKVIREKKEKEIDTIGLVPGDVVILEEGEKVPADIRLIQVANLQTNEASLTGESTPIIKTADILSGNLEVADQRNMVFSGTTISAGRGIGVVIATGDSTQIGKIARAVSETKEEDTPIQKRLDNLGKILGYGTVAISVFVFIFIVFFAKDFAQFSVLQRIIHSFVAAVALAVAAIPEGLPAVVTISLAFGTGRMLKKNALVRKLTSMETLGSVDVICADKTGTLTTGEMTVREVYFESRLYTVTGQGFNSGGEFFLDQKKADPEKLKLLMRAALDCNNAVFEEENNKILGDPTEGALAVASYKAGIKETGKRLYEVPFSSERKMMSVLVEDPATAGEKIVYTKGAPEIVLKVCTKLIKDGKAVNLDEKERNLILEENAKMAAKALRVLGFAYKESGKGEKEDMEGDLIFIGLQGIMDPPRPEVKELIGACKNSGIRIIMITGDHLVTARAVASEIGIKGAAVTGEDLENLPEKEFEKKVESIDIYARVNPEHKLRIVEALKKYGHIVAMTGDGVNDAPALKRADIGIAMGITGTDVAKEASDIVLLDDQFGTIVAAIEEGRGIFDNIRKFVDYLLSCNIGEVLVVFLALLIFKDIPLTAVMLLWINIVTDGLPAVALGLDPAEKGILRHSPKKFQGEIIDLRVWVEIAFFSIALTIATVSIFVINLSESINEARAATFMAIVIFELVRLANIRSDYKISWLENVWLPLAIVSSILLQLILVYVPTLANWFQIEPIDSFDWLYIGLVSIILFLTFKLLDRLLDKIASLREAKFS